MNDAAHLHAVLDDIERQHEAQLRLYWKLYGRSSRVPPAWVQQLVRLRNRVLRRG